MIILHLQHENSKYSMTIPKMPPASQLCLTAVWACGNCDGHFHYFLTFHRKTYKSIHWENNLQANCYISSQLESTESCSKLCGKCIIMHFPAIDIYWNMNFNKTNTDKSNTHFCVKISENESPKSKLVSCKTSIFLLYPLKL